MRYLTPLLANDKTHMLVHQNLPIVPVASGRICHRVYDRLVDIIVDGKAKHTDSLAERILTLMYLFDNKSPSTVEGLRTQLYLFQNKGVINVS